MRESLPNVTAPQPERPRIPDARQYRCEECPYDASDLADLLRHFFDDPSHDEVD